MKTAPIVLLEAMHQLLPQSKDPLAPVYEGISNALEAIYQAEGRADTQEQGDIGVTFVYSGLMNKAATLNSIIITDNGIGFTDDNFSRFKNLLDRTKGYNNQGSGRIQYLHRAESVTIESVFRRDAQLIRRQFTCDRENYVSAPTDVVAESSTSIGTKIELRDLKYTQSELAVLNSMDVDWLKSQIINHFLLRFYLDKKMHRLPLIKITLKMPEDAPPYRIVNPEDVPSPYKEGEFNVHYSCAKDPKAEEIEWIPSAAAPETLKWAHFRMPQSELRQNVIMLCSKNVPVLPVDIKVIKKTEIIDGCRYMTAVYGDVLNKRESTSHSVDSFTFPKRKDVEAEAGKLFFDPMHPYLFMEAIEEGVEGAIPEIYSDVIDLQKQKEDRVKALAKAYGIPLETALSARVKLSDTEHQATSKIFKQQAERLATGAFKIKKLYEKLKSLNPTDPNYEVELQKHTNELLERIPPQNKQELAGYVIRREMVTWVLKLILAKELDYQTEGEPTTKNGRKRKKKDKEGLIHDLIFKRKSKSTNGPNALWVLNEEFVHFEGCADLPLKQLVDKNGDKLLREITDEELEKYAPKRGQRPDIFLHPEEGQCVLVEFKDPDESLSDHLNQMTKYCNVMANFGTHKIQRFFCFLIGETINPLELDNDYTQNVSGDWVRSIGIPALDRTMRGPAIATAQLEVIKLSGIYDRARRRNKSFADKLGITTLE